MLEFCLNEGGRGQMVNGVKVSNNLQAAEKWYLDLRPGGAKTRAGHSSVPTADNAIYRLAQALVRVSQVEFPAEGEAKSHAPTSVDRRNSTGRARRTHWRRPAKGDPAAIERVAGSSPVWNSMLRTTCVATMLEGGHARNALPQLAAANVNCRVLPAESLDDVLERSRGPWDPLSKQQQRKGAPGRGARGGRAGQRRKEKRRDPRPP